MPAKAAKKTTKNRIAKTSTRKASVASSKVDASPVPQKVQLTSRNIKLAVLLAIIVVAVLLYNYKGLLVAATVNGQAISRMSVVKELERQGGKQTLNTMVTKMLIYQDAKKKNVSVSDTQLNQELKKIEGNVAKQGQTLDQVLLSQGMTRDSLKEQILLQKLLEKLVTPKEITDKEIDDYIQANKASFPNNSNPDDVRKNVINQLKQQKQSEQIQSYIQNLQRQAKITYFVNY